MTALPSSRVIPLEPAESTALEPFGQLLGPGHAERWATPPFYADAVRTSRPADYYCAGETQLSLSQVSPRPNKVRFLERHFQHTQAFIPLQGKPFILVMAPPGPGSEPDLGLVRAFRFDGSAGFVMHLGTWHEFPFALQSDTDLIVVLSAQTVLDLHNTGDNSLEASGPDLQKLDIVARCGEVIEFDPL